MNTSARLMAFGGMGLEFAVLVLVGLFLGLKIDQWLGISPVGVIIGIVVGMAAAIFRVLSYLKFLRKDSQGSEDFKH